jgi:hypothetical protein
MAEGDEKRRLHGVARVVGLPEDPAGDAQAVTIMALEQFARGAVVRLSGACDQFDFGECLHALRESNWRAKREQQESK